MMKKPKKSPLGIVKMFLLIPALLIAMGLTTGMTPMQEKTINGKVVFAEDGSPAPGTSIVIANSTVGTVTDIDGTFKLNVEGDPYIVASFVGFKTLKVKASKIGKKPLELEAQTYEMDLEDTPADFNFKANNITITGTGDSDKEPVYVVDGKVVDNIEKLDPESIESVSVFKDPDSKEVKKYNAPQGVVIITSKKAAAKAEKPAVQNPEKEVFYIVEDMPSFPGGKSALKTYIYSRLVYPEKLKKKGINGEVKVQFLVAGSGEVRNVKAVSSTDKGFEKAALEAFEDMPDWKPGKQRGKAVAVNVVIPVRFDADKE